MADLTGDLNWYDLYRTDAAPISPSKESRMGKTMVNGVEKKYIKGMTMSEYTPWMSRFIK